MHVPLKTRMKCSEGNLNISSHTALKGLIKIGVRAQWERLYHKRQRWHLYLKKTSQIKLVF